MTSFPVSSVDYEHMFELAPVSLWLEDYSALRQLFTRWRAEGVSDIRAHLAGDPERLGACSAALKVLGSTNAPWCFSQRPIRPR